MRRIAFMLIPLLYLFLIRQPASAEEYDTVGDRQTALSLLEALEQGFGVASSPFVSRALKQNGLELIKHFEGWRAKAYNDPAGYCTIGYGHLIALRNCSPSIVADIRNLIPSFNGELSPEQGEALLIRDSAFARKEVVRLTKVDLTDNEFDALVSFVFNVGSRNFKNSTLLKRLNADRKDLAAAQFGRWRYSNGIEYTGLIERRNCERTLFEGSSVITNGSLDRGKCSPYGIATDAGEPIDISDGETLGN